MTAPTTASTPARLNRWEHRSEWPLTVAAVAFLVAYAWPILQPGLPDWLDVACLVTNYATWAAFAVDYAVRVALARRHGAYVLHHLPELAVVVLPVFRPLRLLRVVQLLRILNRQAAASFRGRVVVYVTGAAAVLIFCAALAVLDAERGHPGANITGFGDAIWWAFVTVTTVGYGDYFPVTVEGRAVAIGMMTAGIALIGVVTATFASWLIDRVRDVAAGEEEEDLAAVYAELRALRADLAGLRADLGARGD